MTQQYRLVNSIPSLFLIERGNALLRPKRLARRVRTPLPNLRAFEVEQDRDGNENRGDAAEQGAGPLDAHALEHVGGKKRETRAAEGAEEGVCGDGGSGELFITNKSVLFSRRE